MLEGMGAATSRGHSEVKAASEGATVSGNEFLMGDPACDTEWNSGSQRSADYSSQKPGAPLGTGDVCI